MSRKVIGISIGLLMMAALWFSWLQVANKRLVAKMAEMRAKGEPIVAADFAISIPDDQNAAKHFEAAANAISTTIDCPANSNLSYLNYPPFPPAWHQLADASVVANKRALALAREARPFDRACWWPVPPSPVYRGFTASWLNDAMALANVLGDAALQAHANGDDADAMEYLLDLLHEEDSLNRSSFILVHRLVAIGINALAIERLEVITADDLLVKNAPFSGLPTTQPKRAVDRAVIEQLIVRLLNGRSEREGQLRAYRGEGMWNVDSVQSLVPEATVLRPLLKLEEIQLINYYDILLSAAGQPNRAAGQAVIDRGIADSSGFLKNVVCLILPSEERILEIECRGLAERRVAAVSLSAQLYRCDHGQWPGSLNALVPDYLPNVPSDPFLNPDAPLGYVLENPSTTLQRPLVYFQAGTIGPSTPPPTPCFGWQSSIGRQWRDLSLWTAPPSSQALNHDP